MIRGTTPRIIFKINNLEDFSEIKDVWISIKNKNCSLLNKSYLNEEVDLDEILRSYYLQYKVILFNRKE